MVVVDRMGFLIAFLRFRWLLGGVPRTLRPAHFLNVLLLVLQGVGSAQHFKYVFKHVLFSNCCLAIVFCNYVLQTQEFLTVVKAQQVVTALKSKKS